MGYVAGTDREQGSLLPERIEDYVAADASVWVIDAFVDGLDMVGLGFERECRRNIEAMWLMCRLAPDFETISDFCRDNGPAIVGACRAFVLVCREARLFTARLVALDGSKFRAAASAKKVISRREIDEERARLDRKIAGYLSGLEAADADEPDDAPDALARAIAALKDRRAELDRLAGWLKE